jgi:hypothetical protein
MVPTSMIPSPLHLSATTRDHRDHRDYRDYRDYLRSSRLPAIIAAGDSSPRRRVDNLFYAFYTFIAFRTHLLNSPSCTRLNSNGLLYGPHSAHP